MQGKLIFDPEAIKELRTLDAGNAAGLVNSLIMMFETSAEKTIREMIVAADVDDPESLGALAHTLRSTSGNLGAMRFSFICEEIERITMYERGKTRIVGGDLVRQLLELLPETLSYLNEEKI